MSSSDAQTPLTRRELRERERAAHRASQPATPPPTVPTSDAASQRHRPGSHVAPAPQSVQQSAPASVSAQPPTSAIEIVPGTGMTRRQLRLLREAEEQNGQPVPLQAPEDDEASGRTVEDVLGSVSSLEGGTGSEPGGFRPEAVQQATEADGSPDALEPLDEAASEASAPPRRRSTWAARDEGDAAQDDAQASVPDSEASGFPLSLTDDDDADDETNPSVAASGTRTVEPKPVTSAFQRPAGHWSQVGHHDRNTEVEDRETGELHHVEPATNSIVVPGTAFGDVTGALNSTGEVILTGSISLPKSLSATGSHRPIDGAEVDRLLDQHDDQPETDASPVSAARAISSHASTRQVVLAAAKPKESKTPLILGITAAGLGAAAVALTVIVLVSSNSWL